MTSSLIDRLIEAQLDFLDQTLAEPDNIQSEFIACYEWLKNQSLENIWTFEQIHSLIETQILNTPVSTFLVKQIVDHIGFAITHSVNDTTTIEDIIPVLSVDQIAQYIASKTSHREALIHKVTNNPAFSAMMTQLIQHAIQDYLDNSDMVKKVPGVGRFMKMGKSVLESVTDANLDETIANYLQKNILKLSQVSEAVLNHHFTDEKLYHFQADLWHKVKKLPVNVVRNYIEVNDLPKTVGYGHDVWQHLQGTHFLKQHIHDGLQSWYVKNQKRSFDELLRDLNIESALVEQQLNALVLPLFQELIKSGHFRERARVYLKQFYCSERVKEILG